MVTLHVSVWVEMPKDLAKNLVFRSRSTWACELKFGNCLYVLHGCWSRSTWACELKWIRMVSCVLRRRRHAPRERVSWNVACVLCVLQGHCHAPRERVSWNFQYPCFTSCTSGHAPRERVSWNALADFATGWIKGHAPRERVSWNASLCCSMP